MSLGGNYASAFELDMIRYAMDNGIVIYCFDGQRRIKKGKYPAGYAGVIAVGATHANGEKVGFSTSGTNISVMAPGYNIYSTFNQDANSYIDMSGTSMSAPFVTGLVAYMLTFNPTLTADQIKTILEETATDMQTSGWDADTGYGLVDVKKAVERVKNNNIPPVGQSYSSGTAKITVRNIDEDYHSGMNDDKAVPEIPVYLYGGDGSFVAVGISNYTDGSVSFNLLKPGTYTAKTAWGGIPKSVTFTMDAHQDCSKTIEYNMKAYYAQTCINLAKDPWRESYADTVLTVFTANEALVEGPYDYDYLDTLMFPVTPGGSYVLGIQPYTNDADSWGEYGLLITNQRPTQWYVNTTNGRGSGPDDTFEPNDDFASAKQIDVETAYGLYLGNADYFRFTIPH